MDWRFCGVCAVGLALSLAMASSSLAYRPFESTDAAVVEPKEVELELGVFGLQREDGADRYFAPQVVLDVGLIPRWELVGEFEIVFPEDARAELAGPGLFAKGVVREGVLQGRPGPSFAVEIGALLPETGSGDSGVGVEALTIASFAAAPLVIHTTAGGGSDRRGSSFAALAVIAELPVGGSLRLVAELDGEVVAGRAAEASGLLGLIIDWTDRLALDFGPRRRLGAAGPDWTLTLGFTTAFDL